MSDEKKPKKEKETSISEVILNLHDRVFETEKSVIILSDATKKFTDAVTNYIQMNDKVIDRLRHWSWIHLTIEAVLIWAVFFK